MQVEDERRPLPVSARRRSLVAPALIALAALAVLGLRLTVWRDDRPGGDDDRRLLKALAAEVPRALPPGARVVERHDLPTSWDACASMDDPGGWQPVRVIVRFETGNQNTTTDDVARHLAAAGWSGPVAAGHWVRPLRTGQEAQLRLTSEPPAMGYLFSAQPPGPEPRGC